MAVMAICDRFAEYLVSPVGLVPWQDNVLVSIFAEFTQRVGLP